MTTAIEFVRLRSRNRDEADDAVLLAGVVKSDVADQRPLAGPKEPRPRRPWRRHVDESTIWNWQGKDEFWAALGQASAGKCGSEGLPARLRRLFLDGPRTQIKMVGSVVRNHPSVLMVPLMVCGLLIGLGVYGVRTAAEKSENGAKADAEASALKVAAALALGLDAATQPVRSLAAFIRRQPSLEDLRPQFGQLAGELLEQSRSTTTAAAAAVQLELVPFGIVTDISPSLLDSIASETNLFTNVESVEQALKSVQTRSIWLEGPLALPSSSSSSSSSEGHRVLICRYPVFIPNANATTTWGNEEQARVAAATGGGGFSCSACFDASTGTKFWGFAAGYIELGGLLGEQPGSALGLLRARGYFYSLVAIDMYGSGGAPLESSQVLAQSDPAPPPGGGRRRVVVSVPPLPAASNSNSSSSWQLEVAPAGGFRPDWEGPLEVVVVLVSAALGLLLFVAMLHHRRLLTLLRARLPTRALSALRVGRPFHDYFPTATVLHCNLVGYTNRQAGAGVDPEQVVRLLNEVYGILDDLVERHSLHKVETFDDTYVAVGGCPEPGGLDAVTWATRVAHCSRDMVVAAAKYRSETGQRVQLQMGLSSGPLVAVAVDGGKRLPRYCLMGETLSLAAALCACSQPQAIAVSRSTSELLALSGDPMVMLVPRGPLSLRGGRTVFTSWLQVDLMAGAYGGAYGGRQPSADLHRHGGDAGAGGGDDAASLDGFNPVRRVLPGRGDDSDGSGGSDAEGCGDGDGGGGDGGVGGGGCRRGVRGSLFGSFSCLLRAGDWEVTAAALDIRRSQDSAPPHQGEQQHPHPHPLHKQQELLQEQQHQQQQQQQQQLMVGPGRGMAAPAQLRRGGDEVPGPGGLPEGGGAATSRWPATATPLPPPALAAATAAGVDTAAAGAAAAAEPSVSYLSPQRVAAGRLVHGGHPADIAPSRNPGLTPTAAAAAPAAAAAAAVAAAAAAGGGGGGGCDAGGGSAVQGVQRMSAGGAGGFGPLGAGGAGGGAEMEPFLPH